MSTAAGTSSRWVVGAKLVAQILLSIVAGFLLMMPLAELFDFMEWPNFNTWAMMHGNFGAAWPALAMFSFAVLGHLKWLYRFRDATVFAVGALFGLALQAAVLPGEPSDYLTVPAGLLVTAFAGAALLSNFARRRWLLALIIAFPSIDPSWLIISLRMGQLPWELVKLMIPGSLPLPLSPFIGTAIAALAQRFHRRAPA